MRCPPAWQRLELTLSAPASSTCPTMRGWVLVCFLFGPHVERGDHSGNWLICMSRRRPPPPLALARKPSDRSVTHPRPPQQAQMRALDRKSVKFEKTKNEKCGSHMWEDVAELAQLIRWVLGVCVGAEAERPAGGRTRLLVRCGLD